MTEQLEQAAAVLVERLGAQRDDFRGQVVLHIAPEHIVEAVTLLRDDFRFVMLSDETAVDYFPQDEPRFHLIYQLRTMQAPYLQITLRVPVNGNNPRVQTIEKVFSNANWFERELWDMFGISFEGHSDVRRIIMPADWEGHPLRKDYPLGYEEVQFSFNQAEIQARKPHPKA